MSEELTQRVAELEMRLAFQDDTIEALNDALTAQQATITKLEHSVALLAQRQKELATQMPADAVDAPPPHY
ncbi:SlyX family protein [Atopomonas sediminilitoris]|uniref:SlyX family protein n=1 Tax=Atopomonas sediminilitoris TaxID=2919919 RepID=UPI001F4E745F|nr:SlyX family protein [Atopomonas sediminilitoris]MCJ8168579.1 SlyX family protein [Atopomonas sediminilitoris]